MTVVAEISCVCGNVGVFLQQFVCRGVESMRGSIHGCLSPRMGDTPSAEVASGSLFLLPAQLKCGQGPVSSIKASTEPGLNEGPLVLCLVLQGANRVLYPLPWSPHPACMPCKDHPGGAMTSHDDTTIA